MNAQPQNLNPFAESAEAKHQLSILEGGAHEAENFIGVLRIDVRETDEEGDHRIEVLTLRSGRQYTCVVDEAEQDVAPDIGGAELALFIPGFTEMPSISKSTASNLHEDHASRRQDLRSVSVDRIGYSKYSSASSVSEALHFGSQSKEQTAADLLDIAFHYASGNPTTLFGTSAGFDLVLEMVKQNGQDDTRPNLEITKKIYGIVPCVVAKNEQGLAVFRAEEPEVVTRVKTVTRFIGHCAFDLVFSTIRDPKSTWNSRGILVAWASDPLLLAMLPIHFAGHTEGTDFIDLLDVAAKHELVIAAGGTDPLTAKKQYAAINIIHPGSVDHRVDPNYGHISYPLSGDPLSALGIHKKVNAAQTSENVLKDGFHLATSTAEQAVGLAAKTLGVAGRVGSQALSSIGYLRELSQAA